MNYKYIATIAILIILGAAMYFSFGISRQSTNTGSESVNTSIQETSETANWKTYSNEYFSVKYPSSWGYFTGNPLTQQPVSEPCGVVWDTALHCVFFELAPNQNPPIVGIGIFDSTQNAMEWCTNDSFNLFTECTTIDGDANRVSAITSPMATPKSEFRILTEKNKVVVLVTGYPAVKEFEHLLQSLYIFP